MTNAELIADAKKIIAELRNHETVVTSLLLTAAAQRLHDLTDALEAQGCAVECLRELFDDFPDYWPDGFEAQDSAVKHGIFIPHEVTEPCDDSCACADYGDFPQTCYRKASIIRPLPASPGEQK